MRILPLLAALAGSLVAGVAAGAAGTYQTPESFVAEAFAGSPPEPRLLWLTGERRDIAADILGHAPPALRTRYWLKEGRSVWVLDEIGKEKPITAGFVVERGRILRARVLVFRESRGWEVRSAAWLAQLEGRALTPQHSLDGTVDGISGATLSVGALTRTARLALYYAAEVDRIGG
jgi:hypothetical protein